MSEFKVEVVRLGPIVKHPNANRLGITHVHEGYPVILNISDPGAFKEGDLAVYVPVDALVPANRPEFAFLLPKPERKDYMTDFEWAECLRKYEKEKTEKIRIKARKLRGIFSMGLLVPPPGGAHEGDDVQLAYNIDKYEPDESNRKDARGNSNGLTGSSEPDQPFMHVYTDLEGLRRWPKVLQQDEEVIITEKVHGSNARYLFFRDRLWVGSHYKIKRRPHTVTQEEHATFNRALRIWELKHKIWHFIEWFSRMVATIGLDFAVPSEAPAPRAPRNVPSTYWWDVAIRNNFEVVLSSVPGLLIFGEIYGPCQDLKYGSPNEIKFRAFDAMDVTTRKYLSYDSFIEQMNKLNIDTVPVLYRGKWTDACCALAEQDSIIGGKGHIMEGIVIRPVHERSHERLGRVILKHISERYHLR